MRQPLCAACILMSPVRTGGDDAELQLDFVRRDRCHARAGSVEEAIGAFHNLET